MYPKEADLSPVRSQVLDRGYSNFLELRYGEVRILGILGSLPYSTPENLVYLG